ncbi:MAG: hypothetical protein M3Y91_08705 [Actinomycetota bacterium]|nr:hypothetical protein [Actinomycetota bacterium]
MRGAKTRLVAVGLAVLCVGLTAAAMLHLLGTVATLPHTVPGGAHATVNGSIRAALLMALAAWVCGAAAWIVSTRPKTAPHSP